MSYKFLGIAFADVKYLHDFKYVKQVLRGWRGLNTGKYSNSSNKQGMNFGESAILEIVNKLGLHILL